MIDLQITAEIIDCIGADYGITFHRAYDVAVDDHAVALESLSRLGCGYLLTSGRAKNVELGYDELCKMEELIREKKLPISLLLGGGVSSDLIQYFLDNSEIRAFHGSFSGKGEFQNKIFNLGKKYVSDPILIKKAVSLLNH